MRQVRAAGSYRDYVIEQRRTYALVRHLALRDRATTRDGVLRFLARTGERGLFRRVMSYLPPPPLPPPRVIYTIRVRMVATGEQTFFKISRRSSRYLGPTRKWWEAERSPYTTQWAFSLRPPDIRSRATRRARPRSRRRFDDRCCALRRAPGRPREQATAAAAAADAGGQCLEHLRRRRAGLGAEDAEEAVSHAAACGLDWSPSG